MKRTRMENIKGKRFVATCNVFDFFKPGDIVVALDEDDTIPYCVLEEKYVEGKDPSEYPPGDYWAMVIGVDLEEIEEDKRDVAREEE